MQHPLVNPSLAPFGFVFPLYKERLDYRPKNDPHWINPEREIAKLWQRLHRQDSIGPIPIATIIHSILPAMAAKWRIEQGDFLFQELPYLSRDIALISSIIQWLATSVGGGFLDSSWTKSHRPDLEFVKRLEDFPKSHIILYWTHVCTKKCADVRPMNIFADPHHYDQAHVQERDSAVAEAMMRWLGRTEGRQFIETWRLHMNRIHNVRFKHEFPELKRLLRA